MRYTDMSIYSATRDLPGGPVIVEEDTSDSASIQPPRDQNGNITDGGFIGYIAAYTVVAGAITYCMYLF